MQGEGLIAAPVVGTGIVMPPVMGLIVKEMGSFVTALGFLGGVTLVGAGSHIFGLGPVRRVAFNEAAWGTRGTETRGAASGEA